VTQSMWFTTQSALFQGGGRAWEAAAAYIGPLERLLARRYRWLSVEDREDLLQGILIEIKEQLAPRHDRERGKFRALLQTVVKRRVADHLRARKGEALSEEQADSLSAPAEPELVALDVEASLVEALAACRDHFTQGTQSDPAVLYALADRIVHGRSNAEIARREGVSVDRVARLLRRGREVVFRRLLASELDLPVADGRLDVALEVFKVALRDPGQTRARLDAIPPSAERDRLEDFLARFRAGLTHFAPRLGEGGEFQRGVSLVLEGE
jgi:DNA-directed RNA polymerase specialized sigma24 family protein